MATRITISVPNGDTIIEDLRKFLTGGRDLSPYIVSILHKYKKDAAGIDGSPKLPVWNEWEGYNLQLTPPEVEQNIRLLNQLLNRTEAALQYVKGRKLGDI